MTRGLAVAVYGAAGSLYVRGLVESARSTARNGVRTQEGKRGALRLKRN